MLVPPLESFIPEDHRLRKLDRVLDLEFVHEAVRDCYCQDNGRASVDPEVVIRLFLIQAMQRIQHVRELMRQVGENLAYRWFIGYDLSEQLPDHSTLSRALDRFGDDVFNALFARSIAQCRASGLIGGKVLHLDATLIRADIQKDQAGKPGCADPEARYGRRKGAPGYKQPARGGVVDGKARVIVDVSVMPANRHDQEGAVAAVDRAMAVIGQTPEAVCADSAYANGPNAAAMEERNIRLVSPPPRAARSPKLPPDQFTSEDFVYDEQRDVFVCPAGETLVYAGTESSQRRRRRYRARKPACLVCMWKARCTLEDRKQINVSHNHAALVRLRADSRTDDFHDLYRARAPVSEGTFAESKQWHGLGRAGRRGLSNMLIQSLLIATVLNCKRLMAALRPLLALGNTRFLLLRVLLASIRLLTGPGRNVRRHAVHCQSTP